MPKRDTHYCYECDVHVTDDHEHDSVTYDPVVVPGKYGNGNRRGPKPYKSKLKRTASKIYRSDALKTLCAFIIFAASVCGIAALAVWLVPLGFKTDPPPDNWQCLVDTYVADIDTAVNLKDVAEINDFESGWDNNDLWIYLNDRKVIQVDPPQRIFAGLAECAAAHLPLNTPETGDGNNQVLLSGTTAPRLVPSHSSIMHRTDDPRQR